MRNKSLKGISFCSENPPGRDCLDLHQPLLVSQFERGETFTNTLLTVSLHVEPRSKLDTHVIRLSEVCSENRKGP